MVDADTFPDEVLNSVSILLDGLAAYRTAALVASAEARPFLEKALAIDQKQSGPEGPNTIASLNNLAVFLVGQDDLAAAQSLYEQVLEIRKRTVALHDPATAQSLSNLGDVLRRRGAYRGARPLLEQALAIRRAVFPFDHPLTGVSLHNLATLEFAEGNIDGAERLFEQSTKIFEKASGEYRLHLATSLFGLSGVWRERGVVARELELLRGVLGIYGKILDLKHPTTQRAASAAVWLCLRWVAPKKPRRWLINTVFDCASNK